jgi:hypothetical protein
MAIPFLNNIDLNQNQALNMRLHQLGTAPGGVSGQVYYNTANNRPAWHNGTAWQDIYPFSTTLAGTAVLRDGSGNFTAGTITANLTGVASQATQLQNSRNFSITGKGAAAAVSFNGSGDVALNITALTVVPGDITLANNLFIMGNSSGVGAATAKNVIPLSGFAAAAADVAMGGFRLTNVADPSGPQDAATKAYVDATAQGLDVKASVRFATIAALPAYTYSGVTQRITASANGAFGVDGVTPSVNDRILVKNETSAQYNGIYSVVIVGDAYAPFVLERALDFNSSSEAGPGSFVFVEEGLNLADTGWVMTSNAPIVLDTTAIVWAQFSGAGTYLGGRGMVLSGNTFHFAQSTAYTVGDIFYASGAASVASLAAAATGNALLSGGVSTAPSWGKIGLTTHISGILAVDNGGTGASTLTANGVLLGNGASAVSAAAPSAAAQILLANASNVPTWAAMSGDVTIGNTGVTAIGANKVTYAMLQQVNGLSVIGNPNNALGNASGISAANDNEVLRRSGAAIGFGAINLASANAVTGTLGAGNGGTGLASYAVGDLIYASGATSFTKLALGAQYTVLKSNGTTAPTWGVLNLASPEVSGILGSSNGGTGNAFFGVSGPATSVKTYTFKNANSTIPAFFAGTITGNGSTASFTVTHSLGTKDVVVMVYQSASPFAQVFTDIEMATSDTVTVRFAANVANAVSYRVVVIGF